MRRADLPLNAHRFGPLIAEQDCSHTARDRFNHYLGWGILSLGGIAIGGWVAYKQQNLGAGAVSAGAISGCFLLLAFLTDRGGIDLIRCYEKGVVVHRKTRYAEVAVEDITWFCCMMAASYVNAAYVGTRYQFRFGVRGVERVKQVYYELMDFMEPTLGRIRDHVSGVLAGRMHDDLRHGKSVRWAEGMEFTPEGLKVEPNTGKRSGRGIIVVSYSERMKVEMDMDKGEYTLLVGGYRTREAFCKGKLDELDFFPGLIVLTTIQAALYAQEPESQEPAPWGEVEDSEPKSPFDFR